MSMPINISARARDSQRVQPDVYTYVCVSEWGDTCRSLLLSLTGVFCELIISRERAQCLSGLTTVLCRARAHADVGHLSHTHVYVHVCIYRHLRSLDVFLLFFRGISETERDGRGKKEEPHKSLGFWTLRRVRRQINYFDWILIVI